MAPSVAVHDLRKSFASHRAVDGMTWQAAPGAVTVLLGPNGAGKSTALQCLHGLLRPDGGTVRVLGVDPWGATAAHRARVGVMLQDGGLPNTVDPRRILRHWTRLYAGGCDTDELVQRLDIAPFDRTPVRRLSGGQKQRVALAAALLARPDVAFLDEPTSGLDPMIRRDVWTLVREHAARGCAVVVTTHSFDEAERLADHLVIIGSGRTLAEGAPDQICDGATLEERFFQLHEEAA